MLLMVCCCCGLFCMVLFCFPDGLSLSCCLCFMSVFDLLYHSSVMVCGVCCGVMRFVGCWCVLVLFVLL